MDKTYIVYHSLCRLVHNQKMMMWRKREAGEVELAALRIQLLAPCQHTHSNLEFQAVTDH